jgi:uncharacterized LabA/DUF88 family protein
MRENWKSKTMKSTGLLFAGSCGVFIDAANLSRSAQKFGLTVDYKKLAKFFREGNDKTILRYYGPKFDHKQESFFGMLNAKGFKIITKPIKVIHNYAEHTDVRKANFDVEIAVDAVRLMKQFTVFVLFSGDSDFQYLCKYLKKARKTIVVFSTRWRVAKELIAAADHYYDIKAFKSDFLRKRR